ncbi:MAG: hypothetical protein KJ734_10695 [Chloroflexi bacterium]|nr:hypothetical protein [Chloroflexota bacterium]
MEMGWLCLGGMGLLVALIAMVAGYHLVLSLWQKTHLVRLDVARQQLDLDRERLHVTQQVQPDEYGMFPLLWDGQTALDPNRGIVFSIPAGVRAMTPGLVQPEQVARLLRAGGGWPGAVSTQELLAGPEPSVHWPSQVSLLSLLPEPPSCRALVLGVTVNHVGPDRNGERGPGQPEVVWGDIGQLVHVAVGGSSGWGKSVFLRVLAYQLALSTDPVDLALVDLEGATFAPFAHCNRLLWPVADTETAALGICRELTAELDRRKALYADHPGVDSLGAYNTRVDEPLAPVVILVDEATALLGDKDVESALRTLALRARKYGLWLVLGGQDWKASSLDTAIRNQLATRIQFKAMSACQSRVLLQQGGAEALEARGRALAWLPGRDLVEMQAPFISRQDILAAVTGAGPRQSLPDTPSTSDDDLADSIRALHAEGLSKRQIQLQVFGYDGGKAARVVREVLGVGDE